MYKVLIVDDEELIRKSLKKRLEKGEFPIDEIMESVSGEEAYELILNAAPDIIITDVRMDGMTGIDLIKACSFLKPFPRFIVLTGYAEFDYVQQAINNGAEGYLLKPVANDKLYEAVNKAIQRIDDSYKLFVIQQENDSLKLNRMFRSCMDDGISKEEYEDFIQLLHGQGVMYYRLGLFHITRMNRNQFKDSEDLYRKLMRMIIEKQRLSVRMFQTAAKTDCAFLFYDKSEHNLSELLENLLKSCMLRLNAGGNIVTAGLSNLGRELNASFMSECNRNIQMRFACGNGNIYSENLESNGKKLLGRPEFKKLENDLRFHNLSEINKFLHSVLTESEHGLYRLEMVIYQIYYLMVRLNYPMDENRFYQFIEKKSWKLCENKEEIAALILNEVEQVFTSVDSGTDNSGILEEAKSYLETNYSGDLTLKGIAERFHLNSRYFSSIYKKKYLETPMEFLYRVRMEEAKRLLVQTSIPASEIAGSVGYQDVRYFYKSFKKYTGVTALEYRQLFSN